MISKHGFTSIYKYVYYNFQHKTKTAYWRMMVSVEGKKCFKNFPFTNEGERAAALCYDMKMIEIGKQPVNILVKK